MEKKYSLRLKSMFLLIFLCFISTGVGQDMDSRVKELVRRMTLEEKVGQMTQIALSAISTSHDPLKFENHLNLKKARDIIVRHHVGSILNTGGSANSAQNWRTTLTTLQKMAVKQTRLSIPIIYGIDAIHGANYIKEATLFPQAVAMAATWNPDLVQQAARITAEEIKAVGIPWNFNPVLGLGRQPLWPRFWETFGEDSYAASVFARFYVKGIESVRGVAACMKHYLGYSVPRTGHDRTPAELSERTIRQLFLPPFKAAVDAGVLTAMINSSEISGIPLHSSTYYVTHVLRDELGFKGFVVSDWADIENLYKREKVAANRREAIKMAVLAGVDMSMVPMDLSFYNTLIDLVHDGEVPEARIDQAVSRILRVKFELGLFDHPFPPKNSKIIIGASSSKNISLEAAREAITLLKNEKNLLPLSHHQKILICGPAANKYQSLNGGWTYIWQGNREDLFPEEDQTILQALQAQAKNDIITFVPGTDFNRELNIPAAVKAAEKADVVIACVGEAAYCESEGNIKDLTLPEPQIRLVEELEKTGKPIILILAEGRPRIINRIADKAAAILMAYYPGPQGSKAIVEILFGTINPSGKLPFTYPRFVNDLVTYDHKPSEESGSNQYNPQFKFGSGLSYTNFKYNRLKLNRKTLQKGDSLLISVEVENTGARQGKEAILVFLSDEVRSVTPPVKQLVRFKKITLQPGETKEVSFTLHSYDLSFIGRDLKRITEPGKFLISIGNLKKEFVLK